jgi:hypothetical protein
VEGKKETIYFLARLSEISIRDTSASLTKGICVFLLCVSDYASKGRHTTKGRYALLLSVAYYASKGDACCQGRISFYHECGHISHSVYRETSVRMSRLHFVSPYKVHSQLGQNNGGVRSCPVFTISFPFWRRSLKILW